MSKSSAMDLRSDTVTQPTKEMKAAMLRAPLGDDVFVEDPTINALEKKMALMFGHEAALFCSSGTQTNQIAIKAHTQPGDEIICHELSHIYQYEAGGISFNSGCGVHLTRGARGLLSPEDVEQGIRNDDIHFPKSRLISIENTANKAGGTCYTLDEVKAIRKVAKEHGIPLHMDGARFFNAWVSTKEPLTSWGAQFDSISICLSKGLGCPVGSVLIGHREFIAKSRRIRKILGGGMRQAGVLAAAGLYALDHHIERLALDNAAATTCASTLHELSWVEQVIEPESNVLIFQTKNPAQEIVEALHVKGVKAMAIDAHKVRFVFHLDINQEMLNALDTHLRRLYL